MEQWRASKSSPSTEVKKPRGLFLLSLTQDAVEVRAALGANSLRHTGALVIDNDLALGLTLGLALDAVELAFVGLFSHVYLLAWRLDILPHVLVARV